VVVITAAAAVGKVGSSCSSSPLICCDRGGLTHTLCVASLLRSIWPDTVTYTAAISACGRAGEWQKALLLLEDMVKKVGGWY
jgi:pentatricopeptide repeat protein